MTVDGYGVSLGVDENVEFWLVTVPLCEYNENSCTLKKKKWGAAALICFGTQKCWKLCWESWFPP